MMRQTGLATGMGSGSRRGVAGADTGSGSLTGAVTGTDVTADAAEKPGRGIGAMRSFSSLFVFRFQRIYLQRRF